MRNKRLTHVVWTLFAIATLFAGCATSAGERTIEPSGNAPVQPAATPQTVTPHATAAPRATPTRVPPAQAIVPQEGEEAKVQEQIDPEAREAVARVRTDLAKRLSVAADQIEDVSAESVLWRDSGLGCPKPGMMYLQVITAGHRIVLRSGGTDYEYHTAQGTGHFVLCQDGVPLEAK